MSPRPTELPEPTDIGALGVFQLKRIWASLLTAQPVSRQREWPLDRIVLFGLGLALEETAMYLAAVRPTFPAFEAWVLEHNEGSLDAGCVARVNAAVAGAFGLGESTALEGMPQPSEPTPEKVLSAADHAHFAEHGYVVVRQGVPRQQALAAADALCRHVGIDLGDAGTWYAPRTRGIMTELFHHPALTAHRASARIRGAFADIYGSYDLWMSVDRISFNPPEREGWQFPGPHLHWDVDATRPPVPLLTQGILYLTDTPAHQGAFACVPGFHHRIDGWLAARRTNAYPQGEELGAVVPTPIPGEAGDLVIWHQGLPHAATANVGTRPRVAHYVNMMPSPRLAALQDA